jgi:hypothetical protein
MVNATKKKLIALAQEQGRNLLTAESLLGAVLADETAMLLMWRITHKILKITQRS